MASSSHGVPLLLVALVAAVLGGEVGPSEISSQPKHVVKARESYAATTTRRAQAAHAGRRRVEKEAAAKEGESWLDPELFTTILQVFMVILIMVSAVVRLCCVCVAFLREGQEMIRRYRCYSFKHVHQMSYAAADRARREERAAVQKCSREQAAAEKADYESQV
jgi:hypothetical protein